MCSRYSLYQSKDKLIKRFETTLSEIYTPRYNVSPAQFMPVLTASNPSEFSFFRWGLIPNWSVNEKLASQLFIIKSEQLLSKSPFKQIVKSNRCLIIADGYYEWKKTGKATVPFRVTLATDEAFAFAGIWDSWEDSKGEIVNTYAIITKPATGEIAELHSRMPVILPRNVEKNWIEKKMSEESMLSVIESSSDVKLTYYQVHKVVNSPQYDLPQCLQVAPKLYPGETYHIFD
jgi:putative SOS response-associated peptidase YedK